MTTESITLPPETTRAGSTAAFLIGAIILGSFIGLAAPEAGAALSAPVDTTLIAMIFLLFFELRFRNVLGGLSNVRFLALAWGANFLLIPLIGVAIASALLAGQPLIFAGLMMYFLAPCTDWFLGFTRMARGDTALGAALIPVNLITQLLLFPVWLWLFTRHTGAVDLSAVPDLLAQWFLMPLLAAQGLRFALERLLPEAALERLIGVVGELLPPIIALLIFQIFAGNIGVIAANFSILPALFLAVFLFFTATFLAGEMLSRLAALAPPTTRVAHHDDGRAKCSDDARDHGSSRS